MFVGLKTCLGDWVNNLDLKDQDPTHWLPLPAWPD